MCYRICDREKRPPVLGALVLATFWIGEIFGKTKKIISGHIEEKAEGSDILHSRFVLVIFQIGDFSLSHIDSLAQFGLIQFPIFTEQTYLFA